MSENNISELRNELFKVLRSLSDPETPIDINRARASAEVAQVIINSAKMEIEFVKISGKNIASEFIPLPEEPDPPQFDHEIESHQTKIRKDNAGGKIIDTGNGYIRRTSDYGID